MTAKSCDQELRVDLLGRLRAFFAPTGRSDALWLALLGFGLVLAADQASKIYVVEGLNLRERGAMDVIPPYLNFRMAWNTGVNFGIGGGDPEVTRLPLVVLSCVFAVVAVAYSRRVTTRVQAIGLGVAAGGALGNAIDRLNWGAVADFLNMSCCGFQNPWSFNVADIAIFVGFLMAILWAPNKDQEGAAET